MTAYIWAHFNDQLEWSNALCGKSWSYCLKTRCVFRHSYQRAKGRSKSKGDLEGSVWVIHSRPIARRQVNLGNGCRAARQRVWLPRWLWLEVHKN